MPTFTYVPSYPAQAVREPKTRNAKYGDGYEMRQEEGINSLAEVWDLQFMNRDTTEGDAIDTFLITQKGGIPFDWTTPKGVAGTFICRNWTYNKDKGNLISITARFEQVFDPT